MFKVEREKEGAVKNEGERQAGCKEQIIKVQSVDKPQPLIRVREQPGLNVLSAHILGTTKALSHRERWINATEEATCLKG